MRSPVFPWGRSFLSKSGSLYSTFGSGLQGSLICFLFFACRLVGLGFGVLFTGTWDRFFVTGSRVLDVRLGVKHAPATHGISFDAMVGGASCGCLQPRLLVSAWPVGQPKKVDPFQHAFGWQASNTVSVHV